VKLRTAKSAPPSAGTPLPLPPSPQLAAPRHWSPAASNPWKSSRPPSNSSTSSSSAPRGACRRSGGTSALTASRPGATPSICPSRSLRSSSARRASSSRTASPSTTSSQPSQPRPRQRACVLSHRHGKLTSHPLRLLRAPAAADSGAALAHRLDPATGEARTPDAAATPQRLPAEPREPDAVRAAPGPLPRERRARVRSWWLQPRNPTLPGLIPSSRLRLPPRRRLHDLRRACFRPRQAPCSPSRLLPAKSWHSLASPRPG